MSHEATGGPGLTTRRKFSNQEMVGGFEPGVMMQGRNEPYHGHNEPSPLHGHDGGQINSMGSSTDPSLMYLEQMNKMARMSGFGSVEEMMTFQQNMIANMMAQGGMPNLDQNQIINKQQQQQQYQHIQEQYQHPQPPNQNQQQQQHSQNQQQPQYGYQQQGRGRGNNHGRSVPKYNIQIRNVLAA